MKAHKFDNIGLGIETSPSMSKHIQEGMLQRFAAIVGALVGESTDLFIITGCEVELVGSDYTVSEGVVFYNGELLSVAEFTGETVSGTVPVFKNTITEDFTGMNKAFFGDKVLRDVLSSRYITIEMDDSGTGIVDCSRANNLSGALTALTQDNLGDIIIQSLLGSYTTNDLIKMIGCTVAATIPGTSTITEGAIFYNGKTYRVDAANIITTGGQTLVFKIDTTSIPNKIYLAADTTGNGIADYNSSIVKSRVQLYNGVSTSITFQNSYTQIALPTSYRKDIFGNVQLNGTVLSPASVLSAQFMTLPASYRPINEKAFTVAPQGGASQDIYIIRVASSGQVTVNDVDGSNIPASVRFSLDQVRFNIND